MYDPRITLPGGSNLPPPPPPLRPRALAVAFESRRIPLTPGDLLFGRAPTCHVAIDDMMVSRVHAKIVVTDEAIVLRDLNSMNGVYVNGSRIDRPTPLREGDVFTIGSAEMSVVAYEPASSGQSSPRMAAQREPDAGAPERADASMPGTRKADAFEQLGTIADRLLAAGRAEMAERAVAGHLRQVLDGVRDGREVPAATMAAACSYAFKLAEAKSEGKWFDYVIEVHLLKRRPMDAALTEWASRLVRKRVGADRELFLKYQAALRKDERAMSVSDRILCAKLLAIEIGR